MHTVLFLGLILISSAPSDDAIANAEKQVQEIYGNKITAAKKPSEKIAIAVEMLKTASEMSNGDEDRAGQFVLATKARSLAIEAGDKKTALDAATMLIERFPPNKPIKPSDELKHGELLWKESQKASASKRLELQIQAAECYLKAKQAGNGLEKKLAEKRLGEVFICNSADSKDIRTAIGKWDVTFQGKYHAQWKLFADGSAVTSDGPHGKWHVEPDCIKIEWENGFWDAFHRPLNIAGTKCDGKYHGLNSADAKKEK
jgi:hypothetical protein